MHETMDRVVMEFIVRFSAFRDSVRTSRKSSENVVVSKRVMDKFITPPKLVVKGRFSTAVCIQMLQLYSIVISHSYTKQRKK